MQHRVDALDVPLEVAVRRVHVLPSSLSSCDACTRFAARVHERFASSGPRAPLNRVNALHSALKASLARFRGVSTRRLPNYLAWFCWAREARRGGDAASLLRAQMGSGAYRTGWRGLWRQPHPFHPEISMS